MSAHSLLVTSFSHTNPTESHHANRFQEWLNVLQSVLLSFSLLPILHFTSSEKIMGQHKTNRAITAVIWLLAGGVLAINIFLVCASIGGGQPWWVYTLVTIVGAAYLAFSYSLVQDDIAAGFRTLRALLPEPLRSCLPAGAEPSSASASSSAVAVSAVPASPDAKRQLASPLMAPSPTDAAARGPSSDAL